MRCLKNVNKSAEKRSDEIHCSLVHLGGQVKFLLLDVHKAGQINSSPYTINKPPVTFEMTL